MDHKTFLQLLHLRDNQLESLDGLVDTLKSLSYLNLRGNKITDIAEIEKLAGLKSLRTLVLTGIIIV